jgi:hypothetical protein
LQHAEAEGQPAWTHGYERATIVQRGGTLYGIATQCGNTLPTEKGDNAQISDPNLIHTCEAVFSPGRDPVSPATTSLIHDAERSGSHEIWVQHRLGCPSSSISTNSNSPPSR